MKPKPGKILLILLCTASFLACRTSNRQTETTDSSMLDTGNSAMVDTVPMDGIKVGGAVMLPTKNLVENVMNSADHTTLATAIKAADLATTLSGPGPFTIFAPTNEAFNKLPVGTVDNLLKPDRKKDLQNLLTYHVVSGTYQTTDITDGLELTTIEGDKLKFSVKNDSITVNEANLTIRDIVSNNGITHVIDGVLIPKAK